VEKIVKFERYQFLKKQVIEKLKAVPRRTAFSSICGDVFSSGVTTSDLSEQIATEDSLMLAYEGDAVYSLYIREQIIEAGITKVQVLHNVVTDFINAKSQAAVLHALEINNNAELDKDNSNKNSGINSKSDNDSSIIFTDLELLVIRRARNSNVNVPKSATVQEYRSSTAFEALIGYLYRSHQFERLILIMEYAFNTTLKRM